MKVSASFLKSFFMMARDIFTGYDDSKVIYASIKDSLLSLSLETDISYCASQPIAAESAVTIAVVFADITDLIPDTGEVDLSFFPSYLEISNRSFKANLLLAYGAFKNYVTLKGPFMPVDKGEFWAANRKVTMTRDFSKIYHRIAMVECTGEEAQILFPTMQMATKLTSLEGMITPRVLRLISKFYPSGVRLSDRVWEFTDGATFMSVISSTDDGGRMLETATNFTCLARGEFLEMATSAISRVLGEIPVDVYLYEKGIKLVAKTPEIQSVQAEGDISGEHLIKFRMSVLWLNMVAKVFSKETFKVAREENSVWFVNNATRMVVAVT